MSAVAPSPNSSAWRFAALSTAGVIVVAAAVAWLAAGRFTWGPPEIPKAQCEALDAASLSPVMKSALQLHYRDSIAAAVIREPQNTWSNLAFVFVGALIVAHDRRVFSRLLGAATFTLGLTSGLYHASLLPAIRTADVASMGWTVFAMVCVGFAALRKSSTEPSGFGLALVGLGNVLAIVTAIFRNDLKIAGIKPFDSTYVTVGGVGAVFVLLVASVWFSFRAPGAPRVPLGRLVLLGLVTGIAAFCQISDRPGRCFCAPDSLIQAHAVWHVLMAAAIALAYDLFTVIAGHPALFRRAT